MTSDSSHDGSGKSIRGYPLGYGGVSGALRLYARLPRDQVLGGVDLQDDGVRIFPQVLDPMNLIAEGDGRILERLGCTEGDAGMGSEDRTLGPVDSAVAYRMEL